MRGCGRPNDGLLSDACDPMMHRMACRIVWHGIRDLLFGISAYPGSRGIVILVVLYILSGYLISLPTHASTIAHDFP